MLYSFFMARFRFIYAKLQANEGEKGKKGSFCILYSEAPFFPHQI